MTSNSENGKEHVDFEIEVDLDMDNAPIAVRKEARQRRPPGYLADYDTTLVCTGSSY